MSIAGTVIAGPALADDATADDAPIQLLGLHDGSFGMPTVRRGATFDAFTQTFFDIRNDDRSWDTVSAFFTKPGSNTYARLGGLTLGDTWLDAVVEVAEERLPQLAFSGTGPTRTTATLPLTSTGLRIGNTGCGTRLSFGLRVSERTSPDTISSSTGGAAELSIGHTWNHFDLSAAAGMSVLMGATGHDGSTMFELPRTSRGRVSIVADRGIGPVGPTWLRVMGAGAVVVVDESSWLDHYEPPGESRRRWASTFDGAVYVRGASNKIARAVLATHVVKSTDEELAVVFSFLAAVER